MKEEDIIAWLLEGDVSIQYQVYRDLLDENRTDLQQDIANKGWGKHLLQQRKSGGHWGDHFYQPKWISSHYTLLDLRNLNLAPNDNIVRETIDSVLNSQIANDGGISLGPSTIEHSDVCVNGMFLNYASYFNTPETKLESLINGILSELMPDGGFNCRSTRSGAKHSSLHSTLSVLEGLKEYIYAGHTYRIKEVKQAIISAEEFVLLHQLFISDRTGEIINKAFLKFPNPSRWKYDILRAMDYFQHANTKWDSRMQPALDVLMSKRNKNGTWNVQAAHPGQVHFTMEKAGTASRWNTLKALRFLNKYHENQ